MGFHIINEARMLIVHKYAVLVCSKNEKRIQQKTVNPRLFQTYTDNRQKSRAIRDHKSTQTVAPAKLSGIS